MTAEPKYLTMEEVIDYMHTHKGDYEWVNKSVESGGSWSCLRVDDFTSDIISGILSRNKRFETFEDVGKYMTTSMVNKVRSAYRNNKMDKKFHSVFSLHGYSESYEPSFADTVNEMMDLVHMAQKTWRPEIAEKNLNIIFSNPEEPKDIKYRHALIVRLYKTYNTKFNNVKGEINLSAASRFLFGLSSSIPSVFSFPQKLHNRKTGIEEPIHSLTRAQVSEILEKTLELSNAIRSKLSKSGFFARHLSGGITTQKERDQLAAKSSYNALHSLAVSALDYDDSLTPELASEIKVLAEKLGLLDERRSVASGITAKAA